MIQRAQSYSLREAHDSVSCRLWKLLKNSSTNLTQSQPGLQTPWIPIQWSSRMLQDKPNPLGLQQSSPQDQRDQSIINTEHHERPGVHASKCQSHFGCTKGNYTALGRCLHSNLLCHVTHTHWDFKRKWNSDSSKQTVWNAAHFTLHHFFVLRNIQLIILQVFAFMCVASM